MTQAWVGLRLGAAATALAVLIPCGILIHATAACNSTTSIRSIGATLPGPAFHLTTSAYQFVQPCARVAYEERGSRVGLDTLLAGDAEFAGTEYDFDPARLQQAPDGVLFPSMAGAVVPVANVAANRTSAPPPFEVSTLDVGRSGLLSTRDDDILLSREVLADVFLGKVTTWDDPRIVELNPHLVMPSTNMSVIVLRDNSGMTEVFTAALSSFSEEFNATVGKTSDDSKFPAQFQRIRGGTSMAIEVDTTPNSIGYTGLPDALNLRLHGIRLQNKAGVAVAATGKSAGFAESELGGRFSDRYTADLVDASSALAWPIVGYSYVAFRYQTQSTMDGQPRGCDVRRDVIEFWKWFLSSSVAQKAVETAGMTPLSPFVRSTVSDAIQRKLECPAGTLALPPEPVLVVEVRGPRSLEFPSLLIQASLSVADNDLELVLYDDDTAAAADSSATIRDQLMVQGTSTLLLAMRPPWSPPPFEEPRKVERPPPEAVPDVISSPLYDVGVGIYFMATFLEQDFHNATLAAAAVSAAGAQSQGARLLGSTPSRQTTLHLSLASLVGLFNGTINVWGHPQLVADNPMLAPTLSSAAVRDRPITVVVPGSVAGQTRALTAALATFHPPFRAYLASRGVANPLEGTALDRWPTSPHILRPTGDGEGSGVGAAVAVIDGSIGFALANAEPPVPFAALLGPGKQPVEVTPETIAGCNGTVSKDWFNSGDTDCWPLLARTHLVMRANWSSTPAELADMASSGADVTTTCIDASRALRTQQWLLTEQGIEDPLARLLVVPAFRPARVAAAAGSLDQVVCDGELVLHRLVPCFAGQERITESLCRTCPRGTYNTRPGEACAICPEDATCFGGDHIAARANYWQSDNDPADLYGCLAGACCLEGNCSRTDSDRCANHREGPACGTCPADRTLVSDACVTCDKTNWGWVGLLVALAIVYVTFTSALPGKQVGFRATLPIAIDWVQLLSLVYQSPVGAVLSIFSLDFSLPSGEGEPQCITPLGPWGQLLSPVYLPTLLMVVWGLVGVGFYIRARIKGWNRQKWWWRMTHSAWQILFMSYVALAQAGMRTIACREIDDKLVVAFETSIECSGATYVVVAIISVALAALTLGVVPILMCRLNRRTLRRIREFRANMAEGVDPAGGKGGEEKRADGQAGGGHAPGPAMELATLNPIRQGPTRTTAPSAGSTGPVAMAWSDSSTVRPLTPPQAAQRRSSVPERRSSRARRMSDMLRLAAGHAMGFTDEPDDQGGSASPPAGGAPAARQPLAAGAAIDEEQQGGAATVRPRTPSDSSSGASEQEATVAQKRYAQVIEASLFKTTVVPHDVRGSAALVAPFRRGFRQWYFGFMLLRRAVAVAIFVALAAKPLQRGALLFVWLLAAAVVQILSHPFVVPFDNFFGTATDVSVVVVAGLEIGAVVASGDALPTLIRALQGLAVGLPVFLFLAALAIDLVLICNRKGPVAGFLSLFSGMLLASTGPSH